MTLRKQRSTGMLGLVVIPLAILLTILLSGAPGPEKDFFFLQAADPQFGMYTENRDFVQETANFEFVIATANRLRPAFVVVCGDLVNRPGDALQTAEYLRVARKLDRSIPLYNVAGNHDVGNEPTPESLAYYRENFGPDYYSFRHGDFEGIVLDSSLIQHPSRVPEEAAKQEEWLKGALGKTARATGIAQRVVFQHIPWFLERASEPDDYFNLPLATRGRLLEMLRSSGVEYVFAGHYHRNAYGNSPPLRVIITGPVGKPLGSDPSGIRVVHVTASGIQSRYYGLGNLPNQLEPLVP